MRAPAYAPYPLLCATARHFARPEVRGVASAVIPGMVVTARLLPQLFRTRIIDGMLDGLRDPIRRERARQELAEMDPATIMQAVRAVIRFSSHDWVASIDVPTAVVITTQDELVPARRQYKLAAAIPGARVFEVEADHLACVRAANRFVPTLVRACEWVCAESAKPSAFTNAGRGSTD